MYDIVRLMKPLPNVQLWFNNKVIPGGELKLIFWSNANDWKTDISNSLSLLKKIRYLHFWQKYEFSDFEFSDF